jgi:hypothetical protein
MSNVRCPPARRGGKSLLATFGGDRRDIKKLLPVLKPNSLLRESIGQALLLVRSPLAALARVKANGVGAPNHCKVRRPRAPAISAAIRAAAPKVHRPRQPF